MGYLANAIGVGVHSTKNWNGTLRDHTTLIMCRYHIRSYFLLQLGVLLKLEQCGVQKTRAPRKVAFVFDVRGAVFCTPALRKFNGPKHVINSTNRWQQRYIILSRDAEKRHIMTQSSIQETAKINYRGKSKRNTRTKEKNKSIATAHLYTRVVSLAFVVNDVGPLEN